MKKNIFFFSLLLTFFFIWGGMEVYAADVKKEALMQNVLAHYLVIQEKLASDTSTGMEAEAQGIFREVSQFFTQPCSPNDASCAGILQKISLAASKIKGNDLNSLRKGFAELSEAVVQYHREFKPKWDNIFGFHCPMAKAFWLQRGSSPKNPYFGKTMEGCGTAI